MKIFKKGILASFIALQLVSCSKDEEPQNTPPVIKIQSFTVAEDKTASHKIGTVTATDANKDKLSFAITKNDNNLFALTTTGDLSIAANKSLDFETKTKHEITVEVSDGKDKAAAVITINVTDVNENNPVTINDQNFTVAEDITDTDLIGKLTITDTDGDASSFTIKSGDTHGLFTVNTTGEIRLKSGENLDYETNTSYTLTVEVSDNNGSSDTATITINVTNVNDVAPTFTAFGPFTVAEDINDTVVIGQTQATDAEGDVITYSLPALSTTGNLFEIDANSGEISLLAGKNLDYETSTYHILPIRISDGVHNVDKNIRINVTDVVEAAIVNIPDANFKAVLLANSAINTNGDNEIQVTEANNFTGTIFANNKNISDVTGIEEFKNITQLFLRVNQITSIDVTNNTELIRLEVVNNRLSSLDVSKNTKLIHLYCDSNQISNIDVTNNVSLQSLGVSSNNLTNLNVSVNTDLVSLVANNNQLSNIFLTSNTNLQNLNLYNNKLNSIDVSTNTQLKVLNVTNNNLAEIKIENLNKLERLLAGLNVLTNLNLNNNSNLLYLFALKNNLTTIDISNNPRLLQVVLEDNKLTNLNLANGNNSGLNIMKAKGNPNLTCIKIDAGFTPPTNNTWVKDTTASYNTSCP